MATKRRGKAQPEGQHYGAADSSSAAAAAIGHRHRRHVQDAVQDLHMPMPQIPN